MELTVKYGKNERRLIVKNGEIIAEFDTHFGIVGRYELKGSKYHVRGVKEFNRSTKAIGYTLRKTVEIWAAQYTASYEGRRCIVCHGISETALPMHGGLHMHDECYVPSDWLSV